jgi:hypothetical protein
VTARRFVKVRKALVRPSQALNSVSTPHAVPSSLRPKPWAVWGVLGSLGRLFPSFVREAVWEPSFEEMKRDIVRQWCRQRGWLPRAILWIGAVGQTVSLALRCWKAANGGGSDSK